ncbi:hypothetical protein D9M72_561450 [compost metagenome]
MQARDETVVAGDLVAFNDFGRVLDQPLDDVQHARHRPHADDRLQGIADFLGIESDGEAIENAALFQLAQTIRSTRRGKACLLRQLLQRYPGIGCQNV